MFTVLPPWLTLASSIGGVIGTGLFLSPPIPGTRHLISHHSFLSVK